MRVLNASVLSGAICALLQLAAPANAAGVGAAFGTRDPAVCADRHAPTSGPISPAQAKRYVQCEYEYYEERADTLHLLDVRSIEIGQPRPFELRSDSGGEFDVRGPMYPLRGSIVKYNCHKFANGYQVGKNCYIYEISGATGKCGRTNFHDWKCTLDGSADSRTGPGPK